MLDKDIDINFCDQYNQTPLQIALAVNCCEIVEILLKEEKIICANDYENNNELHAWVDKGCEICFKLIKKAINSDKIKEKNIKGNNAVHQSIINNNFNSFKRLIEEFKYKEYDVLGEENHNMLQLCCIYGNIVI